MNLASATLKFAAAGFRDLRPCGRKDKACVRKDESRARESDYCGSTHKRPKYPEHQQKHKTEIMIHLVRTKACVRVVRPCVRKDEPCGRKV